MKTVEHFDGSYGVTTDEQFGELVDFLNGKEVVRDTDSLVDFKRVPSPKFLGVFTTYKIDGDMYELFHQAYTPYTPEGANCCYNFNKITQ